jgi:FtsH-binding integral membrane protein
VRPRPSSFPPPPQILNTVYAALGALVFSAYLVVDTQVRGGRGRGWAGDRLAALAQRVTCAMIAPRPLPSLQMIVGGKNRKIQFGPDDYVFAALNIYLDVINLFLMILSLFGRK